MRKYRVTIRWQHRRFGDDFTKTTAEGSSIRRALNSALLEFFKNKEQRERRRDAHADLAVTIHRLPKARTR